METVTHTWQPLDRKLAEVLQVARDYLGPEGEHLPDDEVVHRLMIRALDYRRQLGELRSKAMPIEGRQEAR